MTDYYTTSNGNEVICSWENNILVDSNLQTIQWKAHQKKDQYHYDPLKGFSKLGSEASEDALSWNLFSARTRGAFTN